MSEFMFGVHQGYARLPRKARARRLAAAKRHGCTWVEIHEPTGQWKSWFVGRNLGDPFDSKLAARVMRTVDTPTPDTGGE